MKKEMIEKAAIKTESLVKRLKLEEKIKEKIFPTIFEYFLNNETGNIIEGRPQQIIAKKKEYTEGKKVKGKKAVLLKMIKDGFFTKEKTLGDIAEAFKERAYTIKSTSLPPYINPMVRNGDLKRKKINDGKKKYYVYYV